MNKLLVAIIAEVLASMAAAPTADPKMTTKEKQEAVKSTTEATANAKRAPRPPSRRKPTSRHRRKRPR